MRYTAKEIEQAKASALRINMFYNPDGSLKTEREIEQLNAYVEKHFKDAV